jgi:hypothetical protein
MSTKLLIKQFENFSKKDTKYITRKFNKYTKGLNPEVQKSILSSLAVKMKKPLLNQNKTFANLSKKKQLKSILTQNLFKQNILSTGEHDIIMRNIIKKPQSTLRFQPNQIRRFIGGKKTYKKTTRTTKKTKTTKTTKTRTTKK